MVATSHSNNGGCHSLDLRSSRDRAIIAVSRGLTHEKRVNSARMSMKKRKQEMEQGRFMTSHDPVTRVMFASSEPNADT